MNDAQPRRLDSLADQIQTLAERLGGADKEFLDETATCMRYAHDLLTTFPMVAEQRRQLGNIEAYKGTAKILRDFADDMDKGREAPIRTQSALRKIASRIEQLIKDVGKPEGPKASDLTKRGLIL